MAAIRKAILPTLAVSIMCAIVTLMAIGSTAVYAFHSEQPEQVSGTVAEDPKPEEFSPVGTWVSVDDKDNKPRSHVRISERDGTLTGYITKIIPRPGDPAEMKCDLCEGSQKDKPLVGLKILWGLKKDGKEWSGGYILDPENGKSYKCFIEVQDKGKKLKVRGFLGVAALGRTQYWEKLD